MPGKRATIVGMGHLFIVLAGALVAAALVFGVTVLIMGGDQGLDPAEPDGRAVPLPGTRPLTESDIGEIRFDVTLRGYRMAQVDQALRRAGYDLGYKEELIGVLEAEVDALRAGRLEEADTLRAAREAAARPAAAPEDAPVLALGGEPSGDQPAPAEAGTTDGGVADGGVAGGPSPDVEPTDGKAADPEIADPEIADQKLAEGRTAEDKTADGKTAEGETAGGEAELADESWPVGFGTMGDAAAAEPAK